MWTAQGQECADRWLQGQGFLAGRVEAEPMILIRRQRADFSYLAIFQLVKSILPLS
jgi:hypothetical protein